MKKCDGCGDCCTAGPCPAAVALLGIDFGQPCSALEYDARQARYWCGLMRRPHAYLLYTGTSESERLKKEISEMLNVGEGCCRAVLKAGDA